MIHFMHQVISDPTTPAHKEIIDASFGPSGADKTAEIKNRIEKMKDANVRLRITPTDIATTLHFSSPEVTRHNAPRVVDGRWVTDSVQVGNNFLSVQNSLKAAVLIHQTAMYAAHANIRAEDTPEGKLKILPLNALGRTILTHDIQYEGDEAPTTPAQVNDNRHWADLRDKTVNMEQSAEAYRVMAYLCDKHPTLMKRALLEGDKEAYHSILRRNDGSCPPNKKKDVSPLTH
jgi:hypothetical protein